MWNHMETLTLLLIIIGLYNILFVGAIISTADNFVVICMVPK